MKHCFLLGIENRHKSLMRGYFPGFVPVHGIIVNNKEVKTDLFLYEGENATGTSIKYSEHIGWFDDVEYVMSEVGLSQLAWICVQSGVFLFYKERDFYVYSPDEVRLLSGINKCTLPPPTGVGSLRHAASKWFSTETTSHVTLFSELFYGGLLYTVLNKNQRDIERIQPTQSMIMVGSDQWMIQTQAGDRYCVSPYNPDDEASGPIPAIDKPLYVCLIPNTTEIFDKGNGESDIFFKKVTKHCLTADADVTTVPIKTCFEYDNGDLQGPAVEEVLPPAPNKTKTNDTGVEGSPFFGIECGTYDEIALLLRMRVKYDLGDSYQFILPLDKRHTWRTEIIDSTFEIVTRLIGSLIPAWFVGGIREYFVYFTEKNVWSQGKGWPGDKPTRDVLVTLHETKQCFEMAESWEFLSQIQEAVKKIVDAGPISPAGTNILDELKMKSMYDPMLEFVWLSMNLVGMTCHHILGFETNFWLDYLTVSNEMYLKPMVPFWLDSADEQKYYPIIFGGLNFTRQYEIHAVFTTFVNDVVNYGEVLPRPEELKTGGSSSDIVAAAIEEGGGLVGRASVMLKR